MIKLKKLITISVMTSICMLHLCSQSTNQELKFFLGIGNELKKDENSLLTPMQAQLVYVDSIMKDAQGIKLVGQSQGGLRAIAYAGYLKNRDRENSLDTVISIGGPNLGFSPLLKGVDVLKNELDTAANIIKYGMDSITNLDGKPKGVGELSNAGGVEGLLSAFQLENSGISELLETINNPSGSSVPGMTPGSKFIQNNIVNGGHFKFETKKMTTPFGETLLIPIIKYVEENWELPSTVKYGFVVGTDSDIIRMADDPMNGKLEIPVFGNFTIKTNYSSMKNLYLAATNVAAVSWTGVKEYHEAMANAAYLRFWDHGPYRRHNQYARNAASWRKKAAEANSWVANYESNFSSILGTAVKENDSFIPTRDQYIDVKEEFDGKYIDEERKGKFIGINASFNHMNELTHKEIWGTNGGVDTKKNAITITDDGILWRWMYANTTKPIVKGTIVR